MLKTDGTAQSWISLALSVLVASGGLAPAWAESDWYILKANGQPIGQVEIRQYPLDSADDGGTSATVTQISNTNRFSREGTPFELNTTGIFVESPAEGKPLRFSYEYQLGPQTLMQAEGRLQGDQLAVQMVRPEETLAGEATVSGEQFKFPGGPGLEQVYRTHYHDAPGSRFRFQTLSLGVSPQVVDTEVTSMGEDKLALAGEESRPMRKFAVKNPANEASTVYEWRNAEGKLYKAQSIGNDMEMVYASEREVRSVNAAAVDLVAASEVPTSVIPQPRMTYEALYKIAPVRGQAVNLSASFPQSDTQQVVDAGIVSLQSITPNELYLKVTQKEPDDAAAPYPIDYRAEYLQSTPYLQSRDPVLVQMAEEIVSGEKRAYFAARKLQQWVHRNITHKNLGLGFASARDTLLSRSGDCTEHAVLLAALARAVAIPSRVAVGLVYLPDDSPTLGRFVYHMWTEVYVGNAERGNWIPLDATNPEVQVDATHIKIADSALQGADDLMRLTQQVAGLMGRIRIDVLKAMSPSQSVLAVGKQSGVLSVDIPQIDLARFDIRTLSGKAIKHYRVDLPPASLSLETADGLFAYGLEQLSQGAVDKAEDAFQKALGKLRRPVEFYLMGERLAAIEEYPLAVRALRQAKQMDFSLAPLVDGWFQVYLPENPLPPEAHRQFLKAVSLEVDQNARQAAALSLRDILHEHPRFAPAYWHLGQVLDGDEAKQAFEQAMMLAPNDFRGAESLGDWQMHQKQYGAAIRLYRQARDTLKTASFSASKPWLNDLQGKIKLADGMAQLARNRHSVTGWLQAGHGLMLQNRLDEAKIAVQNALAIQPGSREAQRHRFELALMQSDWPTLAAYQDEIAAQAGGNADAAKLMGQYQIRMRRYAQAQQHLQRAVAMNPNQASTYLLWGEALQRQAEQAEKNSTRYTQQAETVLRKALARMNHPAGQEAISLALGQLLLKHGKPSEAAALVEPLLSQNPVNGQAYLLKGQVQLYRGELASARETLEVARLLNPNDPRTLTQLGHVALEEGRDALALDYYQKANQLEPLYEEAALALRNLMDQRQVAGKRPTVYPALSGDEHDYLVQLLGAVRQFKKNNLDFLRNTSDLLGGSQKISYDVEGIQTMQAFVPFLNRVYDTELKEYRALKAMPVPERFAQLHYEMQMLLIKHLELYQYALSHFPAFHTEKEQEAMQAEYLEVSGGLRAQEAKTEAELAKVTRQISEPAAKALFYEAQMDDMDVVNQEIQSLSEALNKLLSDQQTEASMVEQGSRAAGQR